MRDVVTAAFEVAAAVLFATAAAVAAWPWPPLALTAGGLVLLAASWVFSRTPKGGNG